MNVLKSLSIPLIIFSLSIAQANESNTSGAVDVPKPPKTGAGPSAAQISSGVSALAALTGDSRVAAIGHGVHAAQLIKQAQSAQWGAPFLYGLAGLEITQGVTSLKTGSDSINAGNILSGDGNGFGGPENNLSGDGINTSGGGPGEFNLERETNNLNNDPDARKIFGQIPNLQALQKTISDAGVTVDPDTGEVTLANGKKLSQKGLQNAAKKFTSSPKFKKLKASFAKKRRAYLKSRIDRFKSGGGGGYKSAAGSRRGSSKSNRPRGFNFNVGNKKGSRGIASVPGKVKMVNGDPLGAASDNVFHIVERAYQGLVTTKVLQEKIPKLGK